MRKLAIFKLPGKLFHELDTAFLNTWKLENICLPHGQSRAQLHQILASIFSPYAADYTAISSATLEQERLHTPCKHLSAPANVAVLPYTNCQ